MVASKATDGGGAGSSVDGDALVARCIIARKVLDKTSTPPAPSSQRERGEEDKGEVNHDVVRSADNIMSRQHKTTL